MSRHATPLELWKTGYELWCLSIESQAVMTMRVMGMAGGWSVDRHENTRMVNEKSEAFGKAMIAATRATAAGKRPDQIIAASTKPLRRKTRANTKRLVRRGPKLS